jgi:hypothetical protein
MTWFRSSAEQEDLESLASRSSSISGYESESESNFDPDEDIYDALKMEPDSDSELGQIIQGHPQGRTEVTVPYAEPQSVHTFMDDTKELTLWLVKKYPLSTFPYRRPFNHWLFDYCERTSDLVLDNQYRLIDILNGVLQYIKGSPYKVDLYEILISEADLNRGVCTSGYITFIVNTIRGFPEVPTFKGQIFEHRRQRVYHYLNKTLDFLDLDNITKQIKNQTEALLQLNCSTKDLLSILTKYTKVTWVVNHQGLLDILT